VCVFTYSHFRSPIANSTPFSTLPPLSTAPFVSYITRRRSLARACRSLHGELCTAYFFIVGVSSPTANVISRTSLCALPPYDERRASHRPYRTKGSKSGLGSERRSETARTSSQVSRMFFFFSPPSFLPLPLLASHSLRAIDQSLCFAKRPSRLNAPYSEINQQHFSRALNY